MREGEELREIWNLKGLEGSEKEVGLVLVWKSAAMVRDLKRGVVEVTDMVIE